ncbi:hypothetical protein GCM10009634_40200 [Saccharothrix xinjiangensis]
MGRTGYEFTGVDIVLSSGERYCSILCKPVGNVVQRDAADVVEIPSGLVGAGAVPAALAARDRVRLLCSR